MNLSERKLGLIERLMYVRQEATLKQVEEILLQAEIELRAKESLKAIEKGDVLSLDEFNKSNTSWLKKNATK